MRLDQEVNTRVIHTTLPGGRFKGHHLGHVMRSDAGMIYLHQLIQVKSKDITWLTAKIQQAIIRMFKIPDVERLWNLAINRLGEPPEPSVKDNDICR